MSARITEGDSGDLPQFRPRVAEAHQSGFNIEEIDTDEAYSSWNNYEIAWDVGATA